MWLCCVLLILSLQGSDCVQFLFQGTDLKCIANFIDQETNLSQGTNQVVVPRCTNVFPYLSGGVDYDFFKGLLYSIEESVMGTFLIRMSYHNFAYEEKLSKVNATFPDDSTIDDDNTIVDDIIAVDWIHDTFYAITSKQDTIMSSILPNNNQPIINVVKRKDIAQESGLDEESVDIKDLQVDPYEGFLFLLVQSSDRIVQLRSDLQGNDLKQIISLNYMDEYFTSYIDIGDMRLYHSYNKTLYQYNYEGTLLNEFSTSYDVMKIVVLGNSSYLVSNTSDDIYKFFLNEKESKLEINDTYKINTTLNKDEDDLFMKFKLLDARVQRRKSNGSYVCERQDCIELCEVLSTGDTCLCFKDKAKARDGEMCYQCGHSNLTSLKVQPTIVDGNYSEIGDFPWHATLYYTKDKEKICGGTLVSSRAVLTAAHCVTSDCRTCLSQSLDPKEIVVSFQRTQRSLDIENEFRIMWQVNKIHVHSKFGPSLQYANDIALIILCCKVPFSNFVMPACLDFNRNQLPPHETLDGYVPGFGYTSECGNECSTPSERLRHVKVQVMTFNKCFNKSSEIHKRLFHMLTPDKFCIGNGSVSPVQKGDSGGGLTLEYKRLHYVMGVVSTNLLNKEKNKYSFGAFTNVSEHMDWLKSVLPIE